MSAKAHVVVLGGGFAGLETAFTFARRAPDRVRVSVVADWPDFLFKPNTIYIPFGGGVDRLLIPLRTPLARRNIEFCESAVAEVDPAARIVTLADGRRLAYDFLVIATGAAMRPAEIPGLAEHAATIWTLDQMRRLGSRLALMAAQVRSGQRPRVLFLVPSGNKCSGPLYEIAFMLETWLRRRRVRDDVELTWTTHEHGFVQAFGPRLHALVGEEFARRGIDGHTDAIVTKVTADQVGYADGTVRGYDHLIAFPPYVAAVDYPGLPSGDGGFLTADLMDRRVRGHPEIFAPGDAGDFPVKQAFLALLQAAAVADAIAMQVGAVTPARARTFRPTSMCVMEMLDTAIFAQVPLELSGDASAPVRVDQAALAGYRVGIGPAWRLGKKALGRYLPLRFRAGRPFHDGLPWHAMELALRGMSAAFATGPHPS